MGEPFIIIEGVSKKFGENEVLHNISMTINEGERVGFIGRSGSGKTVLLSMLKGLSDYAPTSGRIIFRVAVCVECEYVDGPSKAGKVCPRCFSKMRLHEIDIWNEEGLSKNVTARIAIMFQRTFALFGSLTVYENLIEAIGKTSCEDVNKRAIAIAKSVGLEHRLIHTARDLSGGEKQRVVLGRQLATNPILLLADEPTGTLDPINAEMIYRILKNEAKEGGMTLLVTSHLPEAVEELCEKAVLLEGGKVELTGDPKTVIEKFLSKARVEEKTEEAKTGNTVLKVKDLKKHYFSIDKGVVKALDGVDFEVKERQIFGIIGLSGAGKTTLSRIICGVTPPTAGTVDLKLGDEWINMLEPGPLGRGRATPYIGLLHQEYTLYPHRTILENLTDAIGLELPDEFAKFKAHSSLSAAGFDEAKIEQILKAYPDELSEGERHRVALAQVLIKEPIIVILDEPSGTMDPITQQDVARSIKNARNEIGQTFIIVSHDLNFVLATCEEVILMRDGKIVERGDPAEIVKRLKPEEEKGLVNSKN
ncbi:MAG: methyl coenzyme M reductase system, component A2 [Candidatus Methanomethylicia archaeon]|nr:methyl coenzyme M reductase system, component A2 [Candidatus Methanomethylicia archaeon]